MKAKKILSFVVMFFAMAFVAFAYPVGITLNGNMPFNTQMYLCSNPSCTSYSSYGSFFGNPNSFNILYAYAGTQLFAEYDYAACMVPHAYYMTTDGTTGPGPWSYSLTFSKQASCTASFVSTQIFPTMRFGDTVSISAIINSPRVYDPTGPQFAPTALQSIYSENVTVSLYSDGVLYAQKLVAINTSGTANVSFNYLVPSVGNHTIEFRTTVDQDCTCTSTIPQSVSQTISSVQNHVTLDPIGNYTVLPGTTVSFTLSAHDIYNHPLTYYATGMPIGATLGGVNGTQFSWTTSSGYLGANDITFGATDGIYSDTKPVRITVVTVIPPTPTQQNDLVLQSVLLPSTIYATNQTNITANVQNIGNAINATVNFYIDSSLILSASSQMNANSTAAFGTSWIATPGLHTLFVSVDPLNAVNESNELNNNASTLFFVQNGSGNLTNNTAPFANFSLIPAIGYVPLNVAFTDLSYDLDGVIVARLWNFGDSQTSTLQNPTHTYSTAGTYTVTLTVYDNNGAQSTASRLVTAISNSTPPDRCTDSDGGINYEKQGTVVTSTQSTDYCVDTTTLTEYFCDGSTSIITSQTVSCKYGCKNGACLTKKNADDNLTDDGKVNFAITRLNIYGEDCGDGFKMYESTTKNALYADLTIENKGKSDLKDVTISFSIPDYGYEAKGKISVIRAGQKASEKLALDVPVSGSFDAKVSVTAGGKTSVNYREVQIFNE